jgi:hypothetical protein
MELLLFTQVVAAALELLALTVEMVELAEAVLLE